ncbi:MAG: tetraprenyl-beta-curcumene synthase family protein [Chitinophagales bacterium]
MFSSSGLYHYLKIIIPLVEQRLAYWKEKAGQIPDPVLRTQALASINTKAFHCYGGAVLALLAPRDYWSAMVDFIVAFQTISDYLDNLCDRAGILDEEAFRHLHYSLSDAVIPVAVLKNYYDCYPGHQEEGYLSSLTFTCREISSELTMLNAIIPSIITMINHYSELQSLKHLEPNLREDRLRNYIVNQVDNPHGLKWFELAAATGSTLGMFALVALAAGGKTSRKDIIDTSEAYFPWVCGLHILLDYLIDQEEDRVGQDLNFVSFYPSEEIRWNSLRLFVVEAMDQVAELKHNQLHMMVVKGLLAMYLSDPKVKVLGYTTQAADLMSKTGLETRALYHICRLVRRTKNIY